MSKVITFSRQFPAYHPKAGQPTHFVEKLLNGMAIPCDDDMPEWMMELNPKMQMYQANDFCRSLEWSGEANGWPKLHTIRAGHRWKAGDKFSPRVWSGKPYRSPQIVISEDIEIKKVWDFDIRQDANGPGTFWINGVQILELLPCTMIHTIALNDGLTQTDFLYWFKYPAPFSGQIICWDENVNY